MNNHRAISIICASVLAAVIAALLVSVWEAASIAGEGAGLVSAVLPVFALYSLPALVFGVAAGVFLWSWQAELGDRALSAMLGQMRNDRDYEARAVGAVFAAAAFSLVVLVVVFAASVKLVAGVERKGIGAILAAVMTVAALPIAAATSLPAFRLGKRLSPFVPRLGPVARPLLLVGAGLALVAVAALWVIFTKLDWRALPLGVPIAAAVFAVLFVIALLIVRRIGNKRLIGFAISSVMAIAANLALNTSPSASVANAVAERSRGAGLLLRLTRSRIDSDGDGFSAFFAGPDCDDSDPRINPSAPEIPDNGIDDNCEFGDRVTDGDGSVLEAPATDAGVDARPPPAKNVLFIIVDTLRADRLGVVGYRRDDESLTPALDEFSARSTLFARTYAQAPNTPRSFPSFFTSQYPSQVKVDKSYANYSNVLDENQTMWEVLQAAGIRTVGISSHFYFSEERGIRQGFDEYDNEGAKNIAGSNKDISAPRIVPKVSAKLTELAGAGERFALFVHLAEPHSTYLAHPEYPLKERGGAKSLIEKYDYEIKYVDVWIGKVLAALEASGVAQDTLVVIASDHGEAFGVHKAAGKRMFFHGQTLYDELLRVPLIIAAPGGQPAIADEVVMMLDVAPTIVDLLGLAVPDSFVGRSLASRVFGSELPARPAYAELLKAPSWPHEAKAMVAADGKTKAIYAISDGRWEIYRLENDPEELKNLAGKDKALTAELRDKLGRFIEVDLPRR